MFCDNCGCEIAPEVKICPVCGKKVEDMNPAGITDAGTIEDVSTTADDKAETADVMKQASDIEKNLSDAADKESADVIDTDDMEEEGTTVLKAVDLEKETSVDEDEEGTTVLNSDMLKGPAPNEIPSFQNRPMGVNNQPMQGRPMMGPNGQPMQGRPVMGPNGQPMQGRPVMGPNGQPVQGRPMMGPNGQPMPGPNGQPVPMNGEDKKKNKKKEKAPKQPKPQKAPKPPKEQNASKEKKGKGGKIALIVILIVIVLAGGGAAAIFVPKFMNYNKAEDALNNGKVDEAIDLYNKAKPIKDSKTKVNGGAYFEYAESLLAAGNFVEAADNYRKAAGLNYEGAAQKEKESYFSQAEKLYGEANYTEAAEYYEKAGDVNGAADKVKECSYMNGCALEGEKKYDEAIQAFTAAGDYQDAAEKIKECYYNDAVDKMAAGDYINAKDLFVKSEYNDYADKANECLCLLAEQYVSQQDYSKAIETYGQVDSSYKDCTADIDAVRIKWAKLLSDGKDYKAAVEMYSQVTTKDMTKKINKAKSKYIKDHFDSNDETTMNYICDLRQAGYDSADDDYTALTGWFIESFVNDDKEDYKSKNDSASSDKTIYIHTMFLTENDVTMNLKGYVVYSDGTKSNEVTFGEVKDRYTTWMSIDSSQAIKGAATLYIYEIDTNRLIEKYVFTIE